MLISKSKALKKYPKHLLEQMEHEKSIKLIKTERGGVVKLFDTDQLNLKAEETAHKEKREQTLRFENWKWQVIRALNIEEHFFDDCHKDMLNNDHCLNKKQALASHPKEVITEVEEAGFVLERPNRWGAKQKVFSKLLLNELAAKLSC